MRIGIILKKNRITCLHRFVENIKRQGNGFLLRSYNAHIIVDSEGKAFQYHGMMYVPNTRACVVDISIRL